MTFLEELRICLAGSNDGSLAIDSAREPEVTFKENRKHCLAHFGNFISAKLPALSRARSSLQAQEHLHNTAVIYPSLSIASKRIEVRKISTRTRSEHVSMGALMKEKGGIVGGTQTESRRYSVGVCDFTDCLLRSSFSWRGKPQEA